MKDKNKTPWYKWRFSFAGLLMSAMMLWLAGAIIFNMSDSGSIRFIFLIPILGFIVYIAYNEWKFRKPRHIKIRKKREQKNPGDAVPSHLI